MLPWLFLKLRLFRQVEWSCLSCFEIDGFDEQGPIDVSQKAWCSFGKDCCSTSVPGHAWYVDVYKVLCIQ